MATQKEQQLGEQLVELIEARLPSFRITEDGLKFRETDGTEATIQVANTSQVLTSRTIVGG